MISQSTHSLLAHTHNRQPYYKNAEAQTKKRPRAATHNSLFTQTHNRINLTNKTQRQRMKDEEDEDIKPPEHPQSIYTYTR
jgi:hypothetical protein